MTGIESQTLQESKDYLGQKDAGDEFAILMEDGSEIRARYWQHTSVYSQGGLSRLDLDYIDENGDEKTVRRHSDGGLERACEEEFVAVEDVNEILGD